MYQVQLVWNREFHFVDYGNPHKTLDEAIAFAKAMENSGDGARVKKTQIVYNNDKVIWAYGKLVESAG